jgi:hypothetical protein
MTSKNAWKLKFCPTEIKLTASEPRHNVRKSTDTHLPWPYDVSISQRLVGGDHVWIRTTRYGIGYLFDSLDHSESVREIR